MSVFTVANPPREIRSIGRFTDLSEALLAMLRALIDCPLYGEQISVTTEVYGERTTIRNLTRSESEYLVARMLNPALTYERWDESAAGN